MHLLPFVMKHSSHEAELAAGERRMIVVDDSETILHAICSLLEYHQIAQVVGRGVRGKQALALAAGTDPHFALIDMDMPEMTGLTTAVLLAQSHPSVRVILMSMDPSPQQRVAGIACGAYALISKPRFLRELIGLFEHTGSLRGKEDVRIQAALHRATGQARPEAAR
jgi:DNA-binding NarL/FixJ family response regulator